MTTFFIACAAFGAAVLVVYFALGFFGHGDAGDGGHPGDHDGGAAFGVLTIRALAAAIAAFGLGGMAAMTAGFSAPVSILLGMVAGAGAMSLVVFLLRSLRNLGDSGTIDVTRAVDQIAIVYVPVPGNFAGSGKVQLDVMNRTLELAAVTHGPALATGARVRVVQLVDGQTAEVVSVGIGA